MPHPRRAQAVHLLALLAYGLLSMTICLPSMQAWATVFSTRQDLVQLTFGAYVVSYGACQLVYGPLSDRLGRRRLMVIGLGIAVCGALLAALATRIEALIAARLVQGAGAAACMVLGRAAIQDLYDGPERTRMMAYVGMAMGLCPPLATVLGGQLHVQWGWASNFLLLAALGMVLMRSAWVALPARGSADLPTRGPFSGLSQDVAHLLRQRRFGLNVLILAAVGAAFYAFLSGAPVLLGHLGVGPERVGLFIMMIPLSYIVGNFTSTRVVATWGEPRMRRRGAGLTLAGILGVLLLSGLGWHSPWALSLPLMLLGVGHGLWVPPTLSATVGAVPSMAGSAAALAGVTQQLFGALGAYAVGWISLSTAAPLALLMLAWTLPALLAERLLARP